MLFIEKRHNSLPFVPQLLRVVPSVPVMTPNEPVQTGSFPKAERAHPHAMAKIVMPIARKTEIITQPSVLIFIKEFIFGQR